jgi:S1-C subfamily serine protease
MPDSDSDAARAAGRGDGAPQGGWAPNQPPQGAWPPPPPRGTYPPPPPPSGGYAPPPGPHDPYAPPGGAYPPPPGGHPPAGGAQPPQPAAPRHRSSWAILAAVVAVAVLLSGLGAGWGLAVSRALHSVAGGTQGTIQTVPQVGGSGGQSGQAVDAQAVARKVSAAVVDINTTVAGAGQGARAAGTGMVLTSSGEVLTNHHVVEGSTSIKVTIAGRSGSYSATVVGVSPSADVALIQVQGVSGLPTVTLANSSNLTVGQPVVAIGNALGQGGPPTVTQGTITALDQTITASSDNGTSEQLSGLIQSDAEISPGDSGGPLVNASGQVIGMITAGEARGFRQTTSTVGYAIPASDAVSVVNEIRAGHASSDVLIGPTGFLGVTVRDLDASTAARLGLNVSGGAFVRSVAQGSPAAEAGIAANSVITGIDGTSIRSANDLGPAIHSHKPGERISVTWVDQRGTHTANATLVAGPSA